MLRAFRVALRAVALMGLVGAAGPAVAGQQASVDGDAPTATSSRSGSLEGARAFGVQLAFHDGTQTATLPVGTIRLRVIDHVGGRTIEAPIKWRLVTYGRDANGRRHLAAEVTGATPELVLPAAWYIVHAQLPDDVIKHPVEVTAGRIFKYTLVKN